jgi:hypothetical protein
MLGKRINSLYESFCKNFGYRSKRQFDKRRKEGRRRKKGKVRRLIFYDIDGAWQFRICMK